MNQALFESSKPLKEKLDLLGHFIAGKSEMQVFILYMFGLSAPQKITCLPFTIHHNKHVEKWASEKRIIFIHQLIKYKMYAKNWILPDTHS